MPANTSKVFIDIVTQFTGNKSVKQADSAFTKLAKSIASVVSVGAIEEFGRASVKAFLADDAAANQLVRTLNNLGLAFNPSSLDAYIQNLQNTTGVLDDQLRPAFSQLAVATKDYKLSQDLLNTALDVSQGTGKSLSAVTTALSKAYLGNFGALSRLGAGISKTQIAAKDFNAIQKTLNANFGGDALASAKTYAGQIKILKAAYTDVQEIIGKGIVDAFSSLVGGDGSATQFANSMRDAANYVAEIITGLGVVAEKLKPIESILQKLTGKGLVQNLMNLNAPFIPLLQMVGKQKKSNGISNDSYSRAKQLLVAQNASVVATNKIAAATNKATKAAKDKLIAEKASLVLKTAAKVLDTEQAGILAALNRNLTEEERNRLLLQQALLNDNDTAAAKLAQTIITTQLQALALGAQNPLNGWNENIMTVIGSLIDLQNELSKASGVALTMSQILAQDAAAAAADALDPSWDNAIKANQDFLSANSSPNPYSWFSGSAPYDPMNGNAFQGTINVLIDPATLTSVVTTGQNNSTASGVVVGTTRVNALPGGY
jgi:hypothetical protein